MRKNLLKLAVLAMSALPMMSAQAADGFGGATLYGYITKGQAGIYELAPDNVTLKIEDTGYTGERVYTELTAGWISDNTLYCYSPDYSGTKIYDYYLVTFDMETGQQIACKSISKSNAIIYGALNASNRNIYGFGFSGGKKSWLKTSADNPEGIQQITEIADENWCVGITYNYDGQYMAGIRKDGTIVKINADGSQETLITTGTSIESTSAGLVYSDNNYYFSCLGNDYEYHFYAVNADTQAISTLPNFPDKQCKFMFVGQAAVSQDGPAEPVIKSLEFPFGGTDGKALVELPTTTVAGEPLSGTLTWNAEIDGTIVKTGEAVAGSEIEIEFTAVPEGTHVFSFYANSGDTKGRIAEQSLYIGHDTPAAPANVVLSETEVTWDAVTIGEHGGYVDTATLTYTIYLNGEEIGTTTNTLFTLPLDDDTSLRRLTASVTATAGELTSKPGVSPSIIVGNALALPMYMAPTEDDFALCVTADRNYDEKSWTYNANEGAFYSGYNTSAPLDDWLILPPVELSAENVYSFSMLGRRMRNFFDEETLAVYIGDAPTPEAMTKQTVFAPFTPESSYNEYQANIQVPSDGKWYIGFHCTSAKDQSGIYVKEILLSGNGVTATSPGAVTELKAMPAKEGALEATVSFTFPTHAVNGNELDVATELTATIKGAAETSVKGLPGTKAEGKVATTQGKNVITVSASAGDQPGIPSTIEVFTGVNIPGIITVIEAETSEDMKSAVITWQAPVSTPENYFRPEELTYSVYVMKTTALGDLWEKLADNLTECTYTFNSDTQGQDYYQIGVAASNIAGECKENASVYALLGNPWTLPMADNFDSQSIYTYEPWVIYMPTSEYNTQWGPLPKSVLPFITEETQGNAICGMGLSEGCLGRAGFPVFSTAGYTYGVKLDATFWTGDSSTPDLKIIGEVYGMKTPIEVGTVTSNGDWNTLSFTLPEELLDKQWVKLYLQASFPEGSSQWVVMDDYDLSPLSGVESPGADDVLILINGQRLTLKAEADSSYSICGIEGMNVASGLIPSEGSFTVTLHPGVYMVNVGNVGKKVLIK